jgi:hypothetical protein
LTIAALGGLGRAEMPIGREGRIEALERLFAEKGEGGQT